MTPCLVYFVILSITHCGYTWVFNNIDYRALDRALERNVLEEFRKSGEDYDDDLSVEDLARLRFSLTYPGTKWCGPGNVADSYDDLGTAVQTDLCCREHDNCPDIIAAGETHHNITNDAYYTRLSCECDETFRQCLRATNKKESNTVGLMYFNIIGTRCFRRDYPVTGCVRKGGWLGTKCVEYSYDTSSGMIYQWFDVPNY